jgi:CRISPR-associated endonuclease/helicase Cas3
MPYQNGDIEREFAGLSQPFAHFEYEKLPSKFLAKQIDQRYFGVNNRISEEQGELFFKFVMLEGLLNRLDYAASAHIPVESPNDFLESAMAGLMERWHKRDDKACWNDLQQYMLKNKDSNVIAIAQTGMGKTEAGFLWLGNHKGFFTLPLKSAINAIYARVIDDIVLENKESRVGMLHSDTFVYYLEQSDQDGSDGESYDSSLDCYYSKTKQLSLPLTICTLDQLFTFVFRYRGFEQKLATLSYSKVIIDEVQMYSPDLVAFLVLGLHYITKMGGKFAILTATLPTLFVDLLREEEIEFEPPKTFTDEKIRHSLKVIDKEISADDIMNFSQKFAGEKILVICNTIKSAVALYNQLKEKYSGKAVYLLHSNFTRADRKIKESHILRMGQKDSEESGIWVATQIVEASLDIDFDLLFTELSDLNGLFQRMGRCYRKRILNTQYNCFVFTGGNKRCSGVGLFIDKKIHSLSKEALADIDGQISETKKVAMVRELYTKEKLPDYYDAILENIHYVKSCQDYELSKKEASNRFRNINNISIIPRSVFEEHKTEINDAINTLRIKHSEIDKSEMRMLKARARSIINNQTVDVAVHVAQKLKKEIITINDFEQIIVADCEYNSEEGIIWSAFKSKADGVIDFATHFF